MQWDEGMDMSICSPQPTLAGWHLCVARFVRTASIKRLIRLNEVHVEAQGSEIRPIKID